MQLTQLRLTNVACFKDVVLDFTQEESDAPCPWVILLGPNGTGKSTVLRMLGLAFLGRDLVHQVTRTEDWRRHVRAGQPKGRIVATLLPSKSERKDRVDRRARVIFDLGPEYSFGIHQDLTTRNDMELLDATLHAERLDGGWFACGYGPYRRVLPPGPGGHRRVDPAAGESKAHRFATLFDDALALSRVTDWLVGLEFRSLKEVKGGPAGQHLKLALGALERVLGTEFKRITKDGEVIFRDRGADVPLDRLSDGYRSVGGLVGDLIRRLVDAFPRVKNPMGAEGVVLIDEIDLHLHPAWQATVVEQFRELFPKLQFIVSSHSPFVAQDARRKDKIVVLERDAGGVTMKPYAGFVSGWRADQILTSGLFGLHRTRDASVEEARARVQTAKSRAAGDLSPEETRRLDEARRWLEEHATGPGERPDARELFKIARRFSELMEAVLERGVEV